MEGRTHRSSINATTGALAFLTAPNFEAPTDVGGNNVYDVTVQVSDGNGGSDTQAIAVSVTDQNESGTGNLVAAINIGGGAYTAVASGINYLADPGPGSGTITYSNRSGDPIGGTQDDVLYQTYGYGDFSYAFAVPGAGAYLVQIELIEPWWNAPGSRLFDVALEGSVPTGFNDIDIYARAGGKFQALTLTETVTVSDGTLDVDLNTLVDNSVLSAIAVYRAGGSPGNNPPAITSNGGGNTAAVSIAENTTAVTTVTPTDPDAGQTLSYSINGGADASKFAINATTGALAFVMAPNFEAPTDTGGNNVYDVTVQASDGNGGSDTQAIAVSVTDQNESGTGNLVAAINIGGGAYTAVASGINYVADPGPGSGTITYSNRSGDPIGGTQDDSLYQTYGFGDFSYAFAVPGAGAYLVQIELIEPFWQAAGSRLFDVALEGSVPTGFNDIDIYARAGGKFQALTLTETVTVSDGTLDVDLNTLVDNSLLSAIAVYRAGGSPGNNPPAITSNGGGNTAAVSIAENTTAVTTVTPTDPDAGQTLSYSINGGADASKFAINVTTGALAFLTAPNFEAPTDAGDNNVYDVTVQASDGNGGSDTQAIAVSVTDQNESGTGNLVAAINIGGGAYTAVASGINYVADPGPGSGTITYSNRSGDPIGGTQDDSLYQTYGFGDFSYAFAVPEAGAYLVQIELIEPFWQAAGSRLFDVALEGSVPTGFNDIDIYARAGGQFQALTLTETVTVSDGTLDVDLNTLVDNSLLSAIAVYRVGSSPGNNPPAITSNGGGNTAAVSIAENTTAVTTVTATDPDAGQTLSYSINGGADASKFAINVTTGALAFLTAPNFEAPTDAGGNNVYDVTVQVSDGNGGIDTQAIAVAVQDVPGGTINGTGQAETLTGTGENDVINGRGGNDTLQGLGGNDSLDGGAGNDTATYAASPA